MAWQAHQGLLHSAVAGNHVAPSLVDHAARQAGLVIEQCGNEVDHLDLCVAVLYSQFARLCM